MITPHGPVTVGEIADDSITNAKINSSAAIEGSKIANDSIVDAKISPSAAIAGSKLSPDMTNGVIGVEAGYQIAMGQMSTTSVGAGVDTVATGLGTVVAAVAVLDDDISADPAWVSCSIGASGGDITIKTWKPTDSTTTTPVAAATFGKKVNWIAIGTAAA